MEGEGKGSVVGVNLCSDGWTVEGNAELGRGIGEQIGEMVGGVFSIGWVFYGWHSAAACERQWLPDHGFS